MPVTAAQRTARAARAAAQRTADLRRTQPLVDACPMDVPLDQARVNATRSASHNGRYAQYNGYFDGPEWTFGIARRDVKARGSIDVAKGERVLMRPSVISEEERAYMRNPDAEFVTFLSIRRDGMIVSVPAAWFKIDA
jgi:hypothetical protein